MRRELAPQNLKQESQEREISSNELLKLSMLAQQEKIDYPDNFKPTTPEVINLVSGIVNFQNSIQQARGADMRSLPTKVHDLNRSLFLEFKKIDPTLGDYSDESLYRFLAYGVSKYLADYGIFAQPTVSNQGIPNEPSKPSVILINYTFHKIGRINRDIVEKGDNKIQRDVLHTEEGPLVLDGKPVHTSTDSNFIAQTIFKNIILFDSKLKLTVDNQIRALKEYEDSNARVKGGLLPTTEDVLRKTNERTAAADVAIIKIILKKIEKPTYAQEEERNLAHETDHIMGGIYKELMEIWLKKDATTLENIKNLINLNIHSEIEPIISELKNSSNKSINLFLLLNINEDSA